MVFLIFKYICQYFLKLLSHCSLTLLFSRIFWPSFCTSKYSLSVSSSDCTLCLHNLLNQSLLAGLRCCFQFSQSPSMLLISLGQVRLLSVNWSFFFRKVVPIYTPFFFSPNPVWGSLFLHFYPHCVFIIFKWFVLLAEWSRVWLIPESTCSNNLLNFKSMLNKNF